MDFMKGDKLQNIAEVDKLAKGSKSSKYSKKKLCQKAVRRNLSAPNIPSGLFDKCLHNVSTSNLLTKFSTEPRKRKTSQKDQIDIRSFTLEVSIDPEKDQQKEKTVRFVDCSKNLNNVSDAESTDSFKSTHSKPEQISNGNNDFDPLPIVEEGLDVEDSDSLKSKHISGESAARFSSNERRYFDQMRRCQIKVS